MLWWPDWYPPSIYKLCDLGQIIANPSEPHLLANCGKQCDISKLAVGLSTKAPCYPVRSRQRLTTCGCFSLISMPFLLQMLDTSSCLWFSVCVLLPLELLERRGFRTESKMNPRNTHHSGAWEVAVLWVNEENNFGRKKTFWGFKEKCVRVSLWGQRLFFSVSVESLLSLDSATGEPHTY